MNKTSALITASIRAGAILGRAEDKCLADLTEFAKNMGLVFQITDDILDVCGKEQLLGKATGSDAKHNKLTYPSLYGLEKSKEIIKGLNEKSIAILDKYKNSVFFKDLLVFLSNRSF
jgi:geranylgeranyl diphosphate synthase type II